MLETFINSTLTPLKPSKIQSILLLFLFKFLLLSATQFNSPKPVLFHRDFLHIIILPPCEHYLSHLSFIFRIFYFIFFLYFNSVDGFIVSTLSFFFLFFSYSQTVASNLYISLLRRKSWLKPRRWKGPQWPFVLKCSYIPILKFQDTYTISFIKSEYNHTIIKWILVTDSNGKSNLQAKEFVFFFKVRDRYFGPVRAFCEEQTLV